MDLGQFPFDEDSIDLRLCGSRFRDGTRANARDFVLWGRMDDDPDDHTLGTLRINRVVDFYKGTDLPNFKILGMNLSSTTSGVTHFSLLGLCYDASTATI
jgi:hypothetical protein